MKPLMDCPKCGKELCSEYYPTGQEKVGFWKKYCKDRSDHYFYSSASSKNDNELYCIEFSFKIKLDYTTVTWFLITKQIEINVISGVIPYFEPDFSDYNKLIRKLKTYTTFS